MSAFSALLVLFVYFALLMLIAFLTSKNANSETFFTANKGAPWYLVAFGMIGASLSGVTFISVPGEVGKGFFSYMQIVLGYLVGYLVIASVLLPLYYKLSLTSIYEYLGERFGFASYKTGAAFFILSRVIGSSFRLYLAAGVLKVFLFDPLGVPFEVAILVTILLVLLYTFQGGIKTIVWTDSLQTFFMLLAVGITIYFIAKELGISSPIEVFTTVRESQYSQIFFWDTNSPKNFWKQFLAGAFIAITMTGLDQDMMQKNLTCRSLKESQKNMLSFSIVLVFVNLFFLALGALLYMYASAKGIEIPSATDELFPLIAKNYLPTTAGILFLVGIIAAAYSSADSALASLTTSFCIDFLDFNQSSLTESKKKQIRLRVQLGFAALLFVVITGLYHWNDKSAISGVFRAAGYTYGPLLGLYTFGLFTKMQVRDKYVPFICITAPVLTYLLVSYSADLLNGYKIGFEAILINGALTFLGLLSIKE